jgi:hypothetical protein
MVGVGTVFEFVMFKKKQSPTRLKELHQHEGALVNVIFVHGLGGDAYSTWNFNNEGAGSDSSDCEGWLSWVRTASNRSNIYTLDYRLSSSGWLVGSMAITDRAINVLATLDSKIAPSIPIVFVCHSYGGLLVKQLLRSAIDAAPEYGHIAKATKGIVFLGTPHAGSKLASYMNALGAILRSTDAISELKKNGAQLRDLNLWFRNNFSKLELKAVILYEGLATRGVKVVDDASSDPGIVGVTPIKVDADHIDLPKPFEADLRVSMAEKLIRSIVSKPSDQLKELEPSNFVESSDLPILADVHDIPDEADGKPVSIIKEAGNQQNLISLKKLLANQTAQTFDALIADRLDGFVDRESLTKKVTRFIEKMASGIVLVTADPGFGKTSWAAYMCKQNGYVRHFIDGSRTNSEPNRIRDNLAMQLITVIAPTEEENEKVDWRDGLWEGVMSLASLRSDHKFVLVIDGIDELADETKRKNSNAYIYLFDRELPKNVVVLATTRRDSKIPLPTNSKKIPVNSYHETNRGDVKVYLKKVLSDSTNARKFLTSNSISLENLVERLVENSAGNFMHATLVAQHLNGREKNYSYESLEEIPADLDRYYESHWRRMKIAFGEQWYDIKLPVLAELTENDVPVSVEQIIRTIGIDDRHAVRTVLDEWSAFLHITPKSLSPYGVKQYKLYHKTFRDFICGLDAIEDEKINLAERKRTRTLRNYENVIAELTDGT